jgi:hypothetical protein
MVQSRCNQQVSKSREKRQSGYNRQRGTDEDQPLTLFPTHASSLTILLIEKLLGNAASAQNATATRNHYFVWYTVLPPTTVRKTFVCRIFIAGTAVMSRSRTTKSASIPGCRLPFSFSANSA